jgi:hypothetical protein
MASCIVCVLLCAHVPDPAELAADCRPRAVLFSPVARTVLARFMRSALRDTTCEA